MTAEAESDLPPACVLTLARLQSVLDGDGAAESLAADSHVAACAACRDRIAAARILLAALAQPVTTTIPSAFADRVLGRVRGEARLRRIVTAAGGFAIAASALVAIWFTMRPPREVVDRAPTPVVALPTPAPAPPPPIHMSDEFAKAGEALRETSRTITEPAASAPKLFAALADPLFQPLAGPAAADMEPARKAVADIPDAAKTGLEPVATSAQKAFDRLLRDVGTMHPKPKS